MDDSNLQWHPWTSPNGFKISHALTCPAGGDVVGPGRGGQIYTASGDLYDDAGVHPAPGADRQGRHRKLRARLGLLRLRRRPGDGAGQGRMTTIRRGRCRSRCRSTATARGCRGWARVGAAPGASCSRTATRSAGKRRKSRTARAGFDGQHPRSPPAQTIPGVTFRPGAAVTSDCLAGIRRRRTRR